MEAARIPRFGRLPRALAGVEQQPFDRGVHALAPFAIEYVAHANGAVFLEPRNVIPRDRAQWVLVHGVSSLQACCLLTVGNAAPAHWPGATAAHLMSALRTPALCRVDPRSVHASGRAKRSPLG